MMGLDALLSHRSHPYLVRPDDLNGYGFMHGGRMMLLADEFGYASARAHSNNHCLTLAVHDCRFFAPVQPDSQITFLSDVVLTGRSTLWTAVQVVGDHEPTLKMRALFVYAAIDERFRPLDTPPVFVSNPRQRLLRDWAERVRDSLQ